MINFDTRAAFARILRQQLVALRLSQKLTLKSAAQIAGLSRGGLEKIEAGENLPSIESLRRMVETYGLELGEFITRVETQLEVSQKIRKHSVVKGTMRERNHEELATKNESLELARELARSNGFAEELDILDTLAQLKRANPALFESFRTTLSLTTQSLRTTPSFRTKEKSEPFPSSIST